MLHEPLEVCKIHTIETCTHMCNIHTFLNSGSVGSDGDNFINLGFHSNNSSCLEIGLLEEMASSWTRAGERKINNASFHRKV